MIDPISAQAVGSIGQTGAAQPASSTGTAGAGVAPAEDVTRFNSAMDQSGQNMSQASKQSPEGFREDAASRIHGAKPAETTGPSSTLDSLDKVSADFKSLRTDMLQNASHMGEVGDLIRAQFQVANITMTQTMMGQAGQKSSQGVQQLLKGQ
jgi:hypothetical protein